MPKSAKVLGISTQHDGGCCLVVDGMIKCAISEERLTRRKGAAGWWSALSYCLETTSTKLNDLDLVVFSSYGDRLPSSFDGGLTLFGFDRGRCRVVDHHFSHACTAYLLSPFERALVVVVDGSGNDGETESYYVAEGINISKIGTNKIKETYRGVGKAYEAFTNFLGWTMHESANTMALAAYGDSQAFAHAELFDMEADQVNSRLKYKYAKGVTEFAKENGLDFGAPYARGETQVSRDTARFVQNQVEEVLIRLIKYLVGLTGVKKLCLAGGVALNCVANQRILKESGIEDLFIPPPANDKGQAVGNALYGYHCLMGESRRHELRKDSLGHIYSDDEIRNVLDRRPELGGNFIVGAPGFEYQLVPDIAKEAARLVADGKIVGWFQGGSEYGPRALGQRSILADPRNPEMSSVLSSKVKKREWFRPYAPSVLMEYTSEYFELDVPSPFMLLAPHVRKGMRGFIPSVVHVDGTARLQTVSEEENGIFYNLIKEFFVLTQVPILLNTSFNTAGEPIVESPKDAVGCFLKTGTDYLVLGNFLVRKK